MKLTFDMIKSALQGAERAFEKDGEIFFSRFTEEEEKIYFELHKGLACRTATTAGICLAFKTDAEKIKLEINTKMQTNLSFFALDIKVKKTLVGSINNYPDKPIYEFYDDSSLPNGKKSAEFSLGEGEKEVEIHFPWSVTASVCKAELCGATLFEPIKRKKKLLVYGDSITQGTGAENPSAAYAVRVAEYLDAELSNKAIGSEVYFPELAACAREDAKPDFLMVSYGINDWAHLSYDDAEDRCRRFWREMCRAYPDSRKFALTPIWYGGDVRNEKFGDVSRAAEMIKKATAEFEGVNVIDCSHFVPADRKYLADRIVHPNNEGFDFMFDGIKKELENKK